MERGYSLLEVLVALTILALLAAVAVPNYTDYMARARRHEGRAGLLEAAQWMERWRTERGRYDDAGNPGKPPEPFPWRQIPATGAPNYAVSVTVTPTTFRVTATATGPMSGDVCESLTVDETGLRAFTGARGTEDICWNR